jgi:endogenous inhibitor of DNA gyrase (YacG/DUF329 family)
MSIAVTVYCGTCGGPIQVTASELSHQNPPAMKECPKCRTTVQVST